MNSNSIDPLFSAILIFIDSMKVAIQIQEGVTMEVVDGRGLSPSTLFDLINVF